jgi:hydrogenase expression/formation protein HypC
MCLAVPVLIRSLNGFEAEAEVAGVKRTINIMLTPEAKPGDYVLLHTGYSISIIDQQEAEETMKLLEEMVSM